MRCSSSPRCLCWGNHFSSCTYVMHTTHNLYETCVTTDTQYLTSVSNLPWSQNGRVASILKWPQKNATSRTEIFSHLRLTQRLVYNTKVTQRRCEKNHEVYNIALCNGVFFAYTVCIQHIRHEWHLFDKWTQRTNRNWCYEWHAKNNCTRSFISSYLNLESKAGCFGN